jgi:hypothetical protein
VGLDTQSGFNQPDVFIPGAKEAFYASADAYAGFHQVCVGYLQAGENRRQGLPVTWEGFEASTTRWRGMLHTIHVHYTAKSQVLVLSGDAQGVLPVSPQRRDCTTCGVFRYLASDPDWPGHRLLGHSWQGPAGHSSRAPKPGSSAGCVPPGCCPLNRNRGCGLKYLRQSTDHLAGELMLSVLESLRMGLR